MHSSKQDLSLLFILEFLAVIFTYLLVNLDSLRVEAK